MITNVSTLISSTGINVGFNDGTTCPYALVVLPLKLVSFTAAKINNTVQLNWKTAEEENNKGFYIQHSTDGGNTWKNLNFIPSRGSYNTSITNYSFIDNLPSQNINYYRLKQVDMAGNISFSEVKVVRFDINNLNIYPNPANNYINIDNTTETEKIQLLDMYGRVCIDYTIENTNALTLNTEGIKAGTYVLKITNTEGTVSTFKILKN